MIRSAPALRAIETEEAVPTGSDPSVSIVIPVYNEEANIRDLVEQIRQAMAIQSRNFEAIIVDDGSSDRSRELLMAIATDNPWLHPLILIRNYGQSTALQAGFDHARGEYIVTLDGDLQNDPMEIPRLLDMLDHDAELDAISGWRRQRHDQALTRKLPSAIANRLISAVTGVRLHDYGCALKVYRRHVIRNLRLYGEMHRFIPAMAVEAGARIAEEPVVHRPRVNGASKYGLSRTFRVLLDLVWIKFLMRFMQRPLHAFGSFGLALILSGLSMLLYLAFDKLVIGNDIGGRPLLMLGVLLSLVGVQLLATGLLGEMLTRIYHEPNGKRQYRLREFGSRG